MQELALQRTLAERTLGEAVTVRTPAAQTPCHYSTEASAAYSIGASTAYSIGAASPT